MLWLVALAPASPNTLVSGGVGGLPSFVAFRRWQRAPAHSRRSVGSGTLAAGSRRNDDVTGEPVARGAAHSEGVAAGRNDVATIEAAECRTEAQRPRSEWLTT